MTGQSLFGASVALLFVASFVGAVSAWQARDRAAAIMAATSACIFGGVLVWAVTV